MFYIIYGTAYRIAPRISSHTHHIARVYPKDVVCYIFDFIDVHAMRIYNITRSHYDKTIIIIIIILFILRNVIAHIIRHTCHGPPRDDPYRRPVQGASLMLCTYIYKMLCMRSTINVRFGSRIIHIIIVYIMT